MSIPSTIESGPTIPAVHPWTTTCSASFLVALLGSGPLAAVLTEYRTNCMSHVDSMAAAATPEPRLPGLYRDRDGDIWQKTDAGWRLRRQHGVVVDDASLWEWMDGHVRDYGPFVPLPME
ncbi:hypothetical protein [Nocardia sp. NPDC049149]|uniref:hypothetical protein n=1 Tax=Nocardia sp. NPDC049149 TaxID=3364315 RepID=UPI003717FD48